MKSHIKIVAATVAFVLAGAATAGAESFEALRAMAQDKSVMLADGVQVEGIVVSDYRSMNMEHNPNISYERVDLGENLRTAYIESEDGRYGLRVRFAGIYDNRLRRGDRVRLDLGGCRLSGESNPERYTVDGVCAEDVALLERGVALPEKVRRIGELSDEDLYTFVTISDVEFSAKQGAYANVYERCVQRMHYNAFDQPWRRIDGWASLLKDGDNRSIYMLVNTKCAWRRNGRGVPQGIGAVSGIVVHTPMRRYGGDMGRYSIRPLDERDIAVARDTASHYTSVAEWNWNRNYDAALRLERSGYTPYLSKEGVYDDRVLADIGTGTLAAPDAIKMRLDSEYDTRYTHDGNGQAMRANAALRLEGDTHHWFAFDNRGRMSGSHAVTVEVPLSGVEGRGLSFDFSFIAGNHNINRSWGFPAEWMLEYSTDGLNFTKIDRIFVLRPIAYTDGRIKDVGMRRLSYDAAAGFTEYSVPLPSSLLGAEKLTLRLAPASAAIATLPENPADDTVASVVTGDFRHQFVLRLGTVALRVLK